MKALKAIPALGFCVMLVFGLAACGEDGGGGTSSSSSSSSSSGTPGGDTITLGSVSALYPTNGADWNQYVQGGSISNATDAACDAASDTACIHAGQVRVVEVTDRTFCSGLTASDALGAFDWKCDAGTGTARFISTGLKANKNLSDLIDFDAEAWKQNSVTVSDGSASASTASTSWWSNPVVADNDGGYLDAAGTIYVVTNDDLTPDTGGYIINASSVGLVGRPGAIINGPGAGAYVVSADGVAKDFLWIEGSVDASGDDVGVYLRNVRFSALRNLKGENADTGTYRNGVYLWNLNNNTLSGVATSNNSGFGVNFSYSDNNTLSEVTASNNSGGVYFYSSDNNTLTGVTASNNSGGTGVYLSSSSNNTLTGVTALNNNSTGVLLISSNNNAFSGVTASNNGSYGVYLENFSNNALSGVTASNNADRGVYLNSSSYNMLSKVTATNNGTIGVYLSVSSNNNTLSGVTATNNGNTGVYLSGSSNNTLSGVTASNNADRGVLLQSSSYNTLSSVAASNNIFGAFINSSSANNTLSGLAASNNNNWGVVLDSASENYFTGPLKVGNGLGDCFVLGGTNPGLVHGKCTTSGAYLSGGTGGYGIVNASDATLYNGVTLIQSFMGQVATDDAANASDTDGQADYPTDPDAFDWANFQNSFRGWGVYNASAFHRGRCVTGDTCQIWDWSLALNDTGDAGNPAILGVLNTPAGDDTLTHTWYSITAAGQTDCDAEFPGSVWNGTDSVCETTLLRNAVELEGYGGNDNTLCESGETCLYMPNICAYQGHGNLVDAGTFTDSASGGLTGVTLMRYETNGYLRVSN